MAFLKSLGLGPDEIALQDAENFAAFTVQADLVFNGFPRLGTNWIDRGDRRTLFIRWRKIILHSCFIWQLDHQER